MLSGGDPMRGKTYRTCTTRPDMSRTDWLIAIGIALPVAMCALGAIAWRIFA